MLLVFLTGLRMLALDADPPWTKRVGDIADEGYWVHNARMKVLTGKFTHDPFSQALVTAPLYTGVTYAAFRTFGTSLQTARLTSAIAGLLTIWIGAIVIFAVTRDMLWAGAFALLLGLNDLFFAYNRIGHVESMLHMLTLLSFLALYMAFERRTHVAWCVVSGVAFGLAVLTKLTAVYSVLGIVLAVAVESFIRNDLRISGIVAWVVGAAGPVVVGAWALWANYAPEVVRFLGISSTLFGGGAGLYGRTVTLVFNPLRLATNPFINTFSVTLLLILFAWRCLLLKRLRMDRLERVCTAWLAGTLLTAAWSPLQADRRIWGVLIPLAVIAARVASSLPDGRAVDAVATTDSERDERPNLVARVARMGLFYIVTYMFAAVLEVLIRLPLDARGITYRSGIVQLLAIAGGAAAALVLVHKGSARAVVFGLVAPLIGFSLYWNVALLFPARDTRNILVFLPALCGGLTVAFFLGRNFRQRWRTLAAGVMCVYAVWAGGVWLSSLWLRPHSVRSAAASVDDEMRQAAPSAASPYVAGLFAHQLLLEGDGFPLFFAPAEDDFRGVNQALIDFVPKPRFFLQALGPRSRSELTRPEPMPAGLEGHVLGTHCLYPSGDFCRLTFRVIDLTRFDIRIPGTAVRQP